MIYTQPTYPISLIETQNKRLAKLSIKPQLKTKYQTLLSKTMTIKVFADVICVTIMWRKVGEKSGLSQLT